MWNNYIYSVLLGVFMKIYDDFVDLKINSYPIILDISKIIITMSTYFLVNEFYILGIIIASSLAISNYCKPFDDPFWFAYMWFVGFLCLVYYNKISGVMDSFNPATIPLILFIPGFIYFEETNFTEEISHRKLMSRVYGIIVNTIIVLFLLYFDFVSNYDLDYFVYLIIFVNSYFLTNIIIQISCIK